MSDPADPKTKDLANEPLFGAPASPTEPSPSGPLSGPSTAGPSPAAAGDTVNPLFGASPPAAGDMDMEGAKERVEAGSKERVDTLRRARNAELGRSSPISRPPPITRLSHAPTPTPTPRPSTLIPYLRRLSLILSIVLGAGATLSLVWSALLLPRLHASFSARRALVDQQVDRVQSILNRLRAVRVMGVHAGYKCPDAVADAVDGEGAKEQVEPSLDKGKGPADESKAMIREITSSAHSSSSSTHSRADDIPDAPPLLPDLLPLLATLKTLSSTRGNTSTTRTSLLSTIESYTSALHRQLWNPRPGAGFKSSLSGAGGWGTGYGLGTLDQSLREASGGGRAGVYNDGWEGEGLVDRSEEWDKVRKEVRGIKGMLLGRRSMGIGA